MFCSRYDVQFLTLRKSSEIFVSTVEHYYRIVAFWVSSKCVSFKYKLYEERKDIHYEVLPAVFHSFESLCERFVNKWPYSLCGWATYAGLYDLLVGYTSQPSGFIPQKFAEFLEAVSELK